MLDFNELQHVLRQVQEVPNVSCLYRGALTSIRCLGVNLASFLCKTIEARTREGKKSSNTSKISDSVLAGILVHRQMLIVRIDKTEL